MSPEDSSSQGGLDVPTVFHNLFVGVATYYRNVVGLSFVWLILDESEHVLNFLNGPWKYLVKQGFSEQGPVIAVYLVVNSLIYL